MQTAYPSSGPAGGGLAAGAIAFSAKDQDNELTTSEKICNVFKFYVYNPLVTLTFPLWAVKKSIEHAHYGVFEKSSNPSDNGSYYKFEQISNPAPKPRSLALMAQYSRESLLKLELYDKVNFVKLIKKVASYEEVNLIQKVLFGTSECLRNLLLSVALVTHKIFNFFLPNYLNPAHLISFSAYLVDNISFPLIRPSYVFNMFRNEMYFQQEAAVAQPVYL